MAIGCKPPIVTSYLCDFAVDLDNNEMSGLESLFSTSEIRKFIIVSPRGAEDSRSIVISKGKMGNAV